MSLRSSKAIPWIWEPTAHSRIPCTTSPASCTGWGSNAGCCARTPQGSTRRKQTIASECGALEWELAAAGTTGSGAATRCGVGYRRHARPVRQMLTTLRSYDLPSGRESQVDYLNDRLRDVQKKQDLNFGKTCCRELEFLLIMGTLELQDLRKISAPSELQNV